MAAAPNETRHGWRLFLIWVVVSVIAEVLFATLVSSHVPPGTMTSTAAGAQFDFNVLFYLALPVLLGVWIYLAYATVMWRSGRPGVAEPVGGPAARSNLRVQTTWIAATSTMVMGLFVFGTYELVIPAGAGGGEGPAPIWTTSSHNTLVVQVIAQQWKFTYRYPSFGGFETPDLVLPVDTPIAFHVTSLDVIHDFWAYQLGVKADANPSQDNVAFTTPRQLGQFIVRCDELCGLWHGAMYDSGSIVSKDQFASWAQQTESSLAPNTKLLPPFAYTYVPDANGADGGFYPGSDPYSNVEQYGYQKATPK
ncbi:MAG: cytochrome c oxidase subunit II [Acidobacteriota bacterium]|nr:cytochrome c oxidase subunit II [Acidobacteriota bacterium]